MTPNHAIYSLGWSLAAAVVKDRYHKAAVDAVPVFHPQDGWDRFVITRRISCRHCKDEPADSLGTIWLGGTDAPRLFTRGVEYPLGGLLRREPSRAVAQVLDVLPRVEPCVGDHAACWHKRATAYPELHSVVAELIHDFPGLVASREIFVDTGTIEGQFHPLHLLGLVERAELRYDWFQLETAHRSVYLRINGDQAVYETESGGWSTVAKPLTVEESGMVKQRVVAWLRLQDQPHATLD